jgi:hypothetical protein
MADLMDEVLVAGRERQVVGEHDDRGAKRLPCYPVPETQAQGLAYLHEATDPAEQHQNHYRGSVFVDP